MNKLVSSTKAEIVVPIINEMFSTFGIPTNLKIDNGPPWSGEKIKNFAKSLVSIINLIQLYGHNQILNLKTIIEPYINSRKFIHFQVSSIFNSRLKEKRRGKQEENTNGLERISLQEPPREVTLHQVAYISHLRGHLVTNLNNTRKQLLKYGFL